VGKHLPWIEQTLGVPPGEALIAEIGLSLEDYILQDLFPGVPFWKEHRLGRIRKTLTRKLGMPRNDPPLDALSADVVGQPPKQEERWRVL